MNLPDQLVDFAKLIEARTGLQFSEQQRDLLEKAFRTGMQAAQTTDIFKYYRELQTAPTEGQVWDNLIAQLTVGETYFFRNPSHIAALRERVLPELIDRHRHHRRLRLWSAGCASGEEPYTLAILLWELLPDIEHWNITILGTDINKAALERAKLGKYRAWSFRQTAPVYQEHYFAQKGDFFEIGGDLKKLVTFRYLNLAEEHYPSLVTNTNAMDLILCRNVAIYLPTSVIRGLAKRFHQSLVPEGYLIVGASETNTEIFSDFNGIVFQGATLYQKKTRVSTPIEPAQIAVSLDESPAPPYRDAADAWSGLAAPMPPAKTPTQPTAAIFYRRGIAALQEKDFSQAADHFESGLQLNPNSEQINTCLAQVYANQGKLKLALHHCQKAIQLDPLNSESHYIMALICEENRQDAAAIGHLKKALFLNPNFILAQFNLSQLYRKMRRFELAARHHRQALRLISTLATEDLVPGSDRLTAGQLLTMMSIMD